MGIDVAPGGKIEIFDEGVSQGKVKKVDLVGGSVTATVSGDTATITLPPDPAGIYLKLDCSNGPLTGVLQTTNGRIRNTTRVTTTYQALVTDDIIFCNTDGGDYTVTLPAGVDGQTFKIINCGTSGNNLTVAPNGAELLMGVNSSFTLSDGETLQLTYNTIEGWY